MVLLASLSATPLLSAQTQEGTPPTGPEPTPPPIEVSEEPPAVPESTEPEVPSVPTRSAETHPPSDSGVSTASTSHDETTMAAAVPPAIPPAMAPVASNPWIKWGSIAYRVLDGGGPLITYVQLLNEINRPADTSSRLQAAPSLTTFETEDQSSVYHGAANLERHLSSSTLENPNHKGNYSYWRMTWQRVVYDTGLEEYVVDHESGGEIAHNAYRARADWEGILDSPGAAQAQTAWPWEDPWKRGGIWIITGESRQFNYPDLRVGSDVWNPAWFGVGLDGELVSRSDRRPGMKRTISKRMSTGFPIPQSTNAEGQRRYEIQCSSGLGFCCFAGVTRLRVVPPTRENTGYRGGFIASTRPTSQVGPQCLSPTA